MRSITLLTLIPRKTKFLVFFLSRFSPCFFLSRFARNMCEKFLAFVILPARITLR